MLEIVSSADGGAQWTLHCTGRLHFPPPVPPPPPPLLPSHRPSAESAQETGAGGELHALLEAFGQHPPAALARMAELCVGPDATSGRLSPDADGSDGNGNGNGLGIDPAALSAILQLPSTARLAGDYPASHRITRIQLLQLSAQDLGGRATTGIAFSSRTTADGGAASFAADIAISARTELSLSLSLTGVHFAAERLARPPALPLRSLFFRPELRPDLTLLSPAPSAAAQPLEQTLQLVTHKFPHADLCLADIEPTVVAVVVAAVGADAGGDALYRRRHRSLHTASAAAAEQGFAGIDSYHLLMVPRCSQALGRRVRAGGFVLAAEVPDDDGPLDGFDRLHAVEVAGQSWQLLRRRQHAEPEPSFLISSVDDQLHALLARELPPLDDGRHFLSPQTPQGLSDGEYKLVVYDTPSHSSPPRIPALPLLLHASRIVWISAANPEHHLCQQDEHQPEDWRNQQDPFHGIASGFLRTLCSEHPHIAATHLVVQGACPPQRVAALARLLLAQNPAAGSCESEIVLDGGVPHVRRYLPDDDCSRQMGLLPPRIGPLLATATAADSDWAIVAAPPADGGAVLVARPLLPAGSGRPAQQVRVLASVVVRCPGPAGRFGCFFAGTVIADGNPMVAGWLPAGAGACVAAIADPGHIVELGGASSTALPTHTVAAFAGAAIALLVADQARVRPGDRFLLRQLPPGLARTLGRVVRAHHAETITAADANDDVFCVEWAADGPLTLNGRPVPLTPQTVTPTILRAAGQILEQQEEEDVDLDVLPLNRFAALFEPGRSPLAVLQHDHTTGPVFGLALHRARPAVFRPSCVYVAVGGLGGVGRIVLPWMAARGARHIIVLSRSPQPPPPEMAGLAARIETVAVDASSLAGLQQALARIRRRHTIAGIVHLAAVLHDAPLATMSPHQWDAALQAKARTSWNLHLATRGDHGLEFFVMFSSVSGIVGTRGQANYAAGNAFQDTLAVHRRSLGLPAVAIAVGMLGTCPPDGGKD